ncbi:ARM repeat-containing protein [Hesseltinella vesiculosa]|uniref:Importin-95 n=1 Tax=Hesseltinella vesiculosa TaxID=101127 RepID=A0A1X2GQN1_9FUNG|nr:ARM repeat-containing protein [Hesseltinella vesiculosa]
MDIATLLANTLSPDQPTLEDARQKLEHFGQENFPQYVLALCQCLIDEQSGNHIRHAAGLALKNTLTSKDAAVHDEQARRWLAVEEGIRRQIKERLLAALATPNKQASTAVAQSVAAIAAVELPAQQWTDLIPALLNNVQASNNDILKKATMMTLGFICEQVVDDALMDHSSDILTAVITGARKEEPSVEVRLESINALNNSLEFIKTHFERDGERNVIMQTVCEGTQSESVDVKVASFECLVRIMQQYYHLMSVYMEKALFGLTVAGMNDPEPNVALQAIEFWSTVCDDELEIRYELEQAEMNGNPSDVILYNFANQAVTEVVPVLLWLLTKQEEEEDEDEWNVSMAAATCLSLFAQCVQSNIVNLVVPFVSQNIQNEDWRFREAAVMAFGSILDGPDPIMLTTLVDEALSILITMMSDSVPNVRDTVAWTLGRVCEHISQAIKVDVYLDELVRAILRGLQDNPRIVGNCCWALMNLADQIGTPAGSSEPTGTLSRYFDSIIKALLQFTEQCTENESNCRTSAYEAMSSLINFSADDCIPLVQEVVLTILNRLEATIAMENQILNADDRADHNELQSSLLGVLTNSIRRLPKDISQVADRIMAVVLQLLTKASNQATTTEDALLLVSALTAVLDTDFARYADAFVPILYSALQNAQEYQLVSIALGNVGDIFRALGPNAVGYCREFMEVLVSSVSNPALHASVKPTILSCFGDIAMAVGDKFEPFVDITMSVLNQAVEMRAAVNPMDPEHVDYSNMMMESVVEAFVGIIQGMRSSPNLMGLQQYIPGIVQFIYSVGSSLIPTNDDLDRALVGLLGDIAEVFGPNAKMYLVHGWILEYLKQVKLRRQASKATKDTVRWAREMVRQACQ